MIAMTFAACQSEMLEISVFTEDTENVINIGVETAGLTMSSSMVPIGQTPVTRALDGETRPAEEVSWLVQPLKQGLDITYGKVTTSAGEDTHESVAILQLNDDITDAEKIELRGETGNQYAVNKNSGLAVYTFKYRENRTNAKWYDNGPHYFKGVHVPNRIRYNSDPIEIETSRTDFNGVSSVTQVTNLTTDQSGNVETGTDNDLSNYYLLSHYLGMPANTRISATVGRILLPFRHRLAHVLAYIIIDPSLGAKINGYANINIGDSSKPFRDNPTDSNIRFCNVDVLKGVKDEFDASTGVHTLTPTWAEKVRKVIPHFYGEADELIVYESPKKRIYPKSEGYEGENGVHQKYTTAYNKAKTDGKSDVEAAKAATTACGGYEQKTYTAIPVYDLIVRPTYTSYDNVMYDEAGYSTETTRQALANNKNKIDFQVGLDNGLNYEKEFIFDLDANYETVVYLHISREGVDYNASGSVLWQEKTHYDEWYGLDNTNGHTLSKAGSTWQRAFFCDAHITGDKITDGGFYDENTLGEDGTKGQYLNEATWKEYFAQAYEGGAHHGDYFVLAKDITIDARSLPDNFVFTGHLDGFDPKNKQYHKITLTGGGTPWMEYIETTDYTSEGKLYSVIPPGQFPNSEGTAYTVPEKQFYTKNHHDAVYYGADELTEVDGKTYITTSLLFHDTEYYTFLEIENAITIVTAGDYVPGSNPEAEIVAKKTISDVKVEAYYEVTEGSILANTQTIKNPAKDEYILVETAPSIADVMANEYYIRTGEDESYTIYEKPEALYRMTQHISGRALFAGLNGIYSTRQENVANAYAPGVVWEANVHKEGSYWLPYRDIGENSTNTGWRAEVLNLTVEDGSLFIDEAAISGNVENCKDKSGKLVDRTPAMPKYY